MQETFEANLGSIQQEEKTSSKGFLDLKRAKSAEIEAGEAQLLEGGLSGDVYPAIWAPRHRFLFWWPPWPLAPNGKCTCPTWPEAC